MQGVLSRASFHRSPVSGQKYFTVLSLHISNIYAKTKGIAKKLILTLRAIVISQEVNLVAGDFNGTARSNGQGHQNVGNGNFLRQRPPNRLAPNAGRDPCKKAGGDSTLGTGDTVGCGVIREVVENVSTYAGKRNVVDIGQFFHDSPTTLLDWKCHCAKSVQEVKRTVAWLPLWLKTTHSDQCAQMQ